MTAQRRLRLSAPRKKREFRDGLANGSYPALCCPSSSVPVREESAQDRPFMEEASNASARPGAQHSSQAIERRESTLTGHSRLQPAGIAIGGERPPWSPHRNPEGTLPGLQVLEEYLQLRRQKSACRIDGMYEDFRRRPIRKKPDESSTRDPSIAIG